MASTTERTAPAPASAHGTLAHLLPADYKRTIASWLHEDCPSFDYGGFVVGEDVKTATLYAKSPGILAGAPFVNEIFRQLTCTIRWNYPEGAPLAPTATQPKLVVATVVGPARCLLLGERLALNLLSRASGIATASHNFLTLLRSYGYTGILAGTRKTTPGFRLVEKYAMLVGGVDQHRFDLSSMVMLKDNHIWSTGSIENAVKAARSVVGFSGKIEVEVGSEEEACEAASAGADVVRAVAERLKRRWREEGKGHVLLECSGGLGESNVAEYACNDIDIISTSSIHQSTKHVDFSLKIDH
ncbi:Quinolinate phosphoribosyl transferase [Terfezia claveryi]|nr:Quinolinate phosphoribosyl transferase [Terfezia claveryi]